MSIIVENGTIVAGAESYVTTAFCDTYHSERNTTSWGVLTTALKEGYLRQAMAFLQGTFRSKWKGARVSTIQALDWPRYGCEIQDIGSGAFCYYVPDNEIPLELKYAQAELALFAVAGPLNPNLTKNVLIEQIGPIKVTYDSYSPQSTRYEIVDGYLNILVRTGSSGGTMRLTRT